MRRPAWNPPAAAAHRVAPAGNGLTDAGAEELAAGIRGNKKAGGALKDVQFAKNKLTDKGQTLMAEAFHDAKIVSASPWLTDQFKATSAALQKRDAEETDTLTKMTSSIGAEVKKKGYLKAAIEYRNHM